MEYLWNTYVSQMDYTWITNAFCKKITCQKGAPRYDKELLFNVTIAEPALQTFLRATVYLYVSMSVLHASLLLIHVRTTIDVNLFAGNIRGFLRSQKCDSCGNLLRLTRTPHRDACNNTISHFFIERLPDIRIH